MVSDFFIFMIVRYGEDGLLVVYVFRMGCGLMVFVELESFLVEGFKDWCVEMFYFNSSCGFFQDWVLVFILLQICGLNQVGE